MSKELSFSEHNRYFASKSKDPSLFEADGISLLKIVQQALVYASNGRENRLIKNYFSLPYRFLLMYYQLKSVLKGSAKEPMPLLNKVLFIDNGRERYDPAGQAVSMYYTKLYDQLPVNAYSILMKKNANVLKRWDYDLSNLRRKYAAPPVDEHAKEMLSKISQIVRKVSSSGVFSKNEMRFIRTFTHVFFDDFLFYNQLFAANRIQALVFDNHNYNEGMLAAAKLHGIKTIELQHGLITKNDIYYVYPAHLRFALANACFPDTVLVFGEFWKRKLEQGAEHAPEDILVAGDYTFNLDNEKALEPLNKEKIIFIGAQKFMGTYYIEAIGRLANLIQAKHPDWRILVKYHPSEKDKAQYEVLKEFSCVAFADNTEDLMTLLKKSRIQISYYSTTLYDAMGLDVFNLSIQEHSPYADYCKEVLDDGIAFPFHIGEDPVAIYEDRNKQQSPDRSFYYAAFNPAVFHKALEIA